MTKLTETIEVACPNHYVMHHAQRYFAVHRRDVTPGTISLRVDLSSLKLPGTAQARHDVRVAHTLLHEPGRSDRLHLAWDPDDKTVPRFAGTLSGEEAGDGKSLLTLDGGYEPPLGLAGAAFDAIVGKRVASATIRTLLEDMKQFIESDFRTALATNLASSPKE